MRWLDCIEKQRDFFLVNAGKELQRRKCVGEKRWHADGVVGLGSFWF